MQLDPKDVRVDCLYGSATPWEPMGQTVRVTHTPTGLVAERSDERSQHRNKDKAIAKLTQLVASYVATGPVLLSSLTDEELLQQTYSNKDPTVQSLRTRLAARLDSADVDEDYLPSAFSEY